MAQRFRARRGAIIVLTAVALVALVVIIALAVDVGYINTVRTELQCAADAGALAGAVDLPSGTTEARRTAREYVRHNASRPLTDGNIQVAFGHWDSDARTFGQGRYPRDALRVTVNRPSTPLFFGRIAGRSSVKVAGEAIATYSPRDIMLVLDYSGSMNEKNRISELKSAVDLFVTILQDVGADDRVGFVHYADDANLAMPLTGNLPMVASEVRAGKANGWTNVGYGMELGRRELNSRGRSNAVQMMILMTDGKVNRPQDRNPRSYVTDEARRADNSGIAMVTISFGGDADQTLMKEVASIADGVHFNVPDSTSSYQDDLGDVFRKIALNRPAVLVD